MRYSRGVDHRAHGKPLDKVRSSGDKWRHQADRLLLEGSISCHDGGVKISWDEVSRHNLKAGEC